MEATAQRSWRGRDDRKASLRPLQPTPDIDQYFEINVNPETLLCAPEGGLFPPPVTDPVVSDGIN